MRRKLRSSGVGAGRGPRAMLPALLLVASSSFTEAAPSAGAPALAAGQDAQIQLRDIIPSGHRVATQSRGGTRRLEDCWSYGNFTWVNLLDYLAPPAAGCACNTDGHSGGAKVSGTDGRPIVGCVDENRDPLGNRWSSEFGPWCYVADPANCSMETDSVSFPGAGWAYCEPVDQSAIQSDLRVHTSFINNDDDGWVDVSLPFSFLFYGATFAAGDIIRVSTNGYFTFGAAAQHYRWGETTHIPSSRPPNSLAAVYWADLDPGARASPTAGIYTLANPHRLIIEWRELPYWVPERGAFCANKTSAAVQQVCGRTASFEAILEYDGTILFQYLSVDPSPHGGADNQFALPNHAPAVIGYENMDGSIGVEISYDQVLEDAVAIFIPPQCHEDQPCFNSSAAVRPDGSCSLRMHDECCSLAGLAWFRCIEYPSECPVNEPAEQSVDGAEESAGMRCEYTGPIGDTLLPRCLQALGEDDCTHFPTLGQCQDRCSSISMCLGCTLQPSGELLRTLNSNGQTVIHPASQEWSWVLHSTPTTMSAFYGQISYTRGRCFGALDKSSGRASDGSADGQGGIFPIVVYQVHMPLVLLLLIGLVVLRLCKINRNGFRWRGELVSPAGLPDAAEDMMGNPRALTPLQLASLPPAINSGAPAASELGVDMHSDICSICMDVYGSDPGRGSTNEAAGATLRQLPCGHVFHAKCIETWLIRQRLCPMCKRNVLLADSEQPAPLLPLPVVPPLRHHLATVATGSIGMCLVTMCELAAVWYCAVDDSKMQAIVPPAAVRGRPWYHAEADDGFNTAATSCTFLTATAAMAFATVAVAASLLLPPWAMCHPVLSSTAADSPPWRRGGVRLPWRRWTLEDPRGLWEGLGGWLLFLVTAVSLVHGWLVPRPLSDRQRLESIALLRLLGGALALLLMASSRYRGAMVRHHIVASENRARRGDTAPRQPLAASPPGWLTRIAPIFHARRTGAAPSVGPAPGSGDGGPPAGGGDGDGQHRNRHQPVTRAGRHMHFGAAVVPAETEAEQSMNPLRGAIDEPDSPAGVDTGIHGSMLDGTV